MIRYYCSGFDTNNTFGHGLGDMFKDELRDKKSIVYIPGSPEKIEKAKTKYIPLFTNHFKNVGIEFENVSLITPDMNINTSKETYQREDLIKVAKEYGEFYLLQDNLNENGNYDISIIKSDNGKNLDSK